MRQNVPIDQILGSLKKMMDNKSSRISRYLVAENNYDQYLEKEEERDEEVIELTEEAVIQDNKTHSFKEDKGEKINVKENSSESENDLCTENRSQIKVETNEDLSNNNDKDTKDYKVSEKTYSETSMYLKYLSDKSSAIKNSKEKTINEFIKEAAMPYVIEWLDKNLNKLVKEIVEKEIKRITSDEK